MIRLVFRYFLVSVLVFLTYNVGRAQSVSARPQATVVVKEDSTTAELVEITMLDPSFPEAEMRGIVVRLGEELKCTPRGFPYFVQSFGSRPQDRFVKASVGVAGLINRETGELNLQAVARAFAGVKRPYTVNTLKVSFAGEVPNARTLRTFGSDAVVVDGQVDQARTAIDYLVALRTQTANDIAIPNRHEPSTVAQPQSKVSKTDNTPLLIGLITIASIAAGCLVYWLALARSGASRANRRA